MVSFPRNSVSLATHPSTYESDKPNGVFGPRKTQVLPQELWNGQQTAMGMVLIRGRSALCSVLYMHPCTESSSQPCKAGINPCAFNKRKLMCRRNKSFVRGHTARKWQIRAPSISCQGPKSAKPLKELTSNKRTASHLLVNKMTAELSPWWVSSE